MVQLQGRVLQGLHKGSTLLTTHTISLAPLPMPLKKPVDKLVYRVEFTSDHPVAVTVAVSEVDNVCP